MTTQDYNDYQTNLILHVDIDSSLRLISEKIKFGASLRDRSLLYKFLEILVDTNSALSLEISKLCKDGEPEA